MHLGMQGLHPSIHHFRKAGDVFHADDRNALAPQRLRRAAGGDDLPLERDELTSEIHDAAFVRNGDQRSTHQSSATARTISARLSKSFRSTTSAGECEYLNGQPIGTSTTPNCVNVEPSLPPFVVPICSAIPRARAISASEST